jgi:hypothetical protein
MIERLRRSGFCIFPPRRTSSPCSKMQKPRLSSGPSCPEQDYLRFAPVILKLLRGVYPTAPAPSALRFSHFSAQANKFALFQNAKTPTIVGAFVPRTGFEPAHGFPRCDLNTVRLPVSPSGHFSESAWPALQGAIFFVQGCKYRKR